MSLRLLSLVCLISVSQLSLSQRAPSTFWWRQDWLDYKSGIPESEASKLTITARRLDAPARAPKISKGLGSYTDDWKSFLVGGIDFPTFECWEISAHYISAHYISAHYDDDEVDFVVWVAK